MVAQNIGIGEAVTVTVSHPATWWAWKIVLAILIVAGIIWVIAWLADQ